MEADKNAKKGIAAKRAVRKPRKTDLGSAEEADLKAAAEGKDLVDEPATEEQLKTTRRRTKRSTASGKPGEAKRGATRQKPSPASGTPTSSLPAELATAVPAPAVTPGVEAEPAGLEPVAEALQTEIVQVEARPLEEPTFEQVQLRAYFIAERRRNAGLPGDEHTDWLQAREELSNELKGH